VPGITDDTVKIKIPTGNPSGRPDIKGVGGNELASEIIGRRRRYGSGAWLREPNPALFSLSLAEIASYDVGRIDPASRYAQRFADQIAVDGSRMPTLAERAGNRDVRPSTARSMAPRSRTLMTGAWRSSCGRSMTWTA